MKIRRLDGKVCAERRESEINNVSGVAELFS